MIDNLSTTEIEEMLLKRKYDFNNKGRTKKEILEAKLCVTGILDDMVSNTLDFVNFYNCMKNQYIISKRFTELSDADKLAELETLQGMDYVINELTDYGLKANSQNYYNN